MNQKIRLGRLKTDAGTFADGEVVYLEKHRWDCAHPDTFHRDSTTTVITLNVATNDSPRVLPSFVLTHWLGIGCPFGINKSSPRVLLEFS